MAYSVLDRAALRIAGSVDHYAEVIHTGDEATLAVNMPGLLLRVRRTQSLRLVLNHWRAAGIHRDRLPDLVPSAFTPLRSQDGAAVVLTLAQRPALTSRLVIDPQGRTKPALWIGVGQIGWMVLDRAAYDSMLYVWRVVLRQMTGRMTR